MNKKLMDYDPQIIAWQREVKKDLNTPVIYNFPQPGDNIKKIKFFAVKDYERVLFLNKGTLISVLNGGIYILDKKARIKGTEIIWFDISLLEIPWKILDGIFTTEGFDIGMEGDLKLRINDVKTFNYKVIAGKKSWTTQDLRKWIESLLLTSLRDIIKSYSLEQIKLEDREKIVYKLREKVAEEFTSYGLILDTFNIIKLVEPESYVKLGPIKSILKSKNDKEEFELLILRKKNLKRRINELNRVIKDFEDNLLFDEINEQKFAEKIQQAKNFIAETEIELERIDQCITQKL
jgi:hypothetical protein